MLGDKTYTDTDSCRFYAVVFPESPNRIRGDSFNPQPSGEVCPWLHFHLAVMKGDACYRTRGVAHAVKRTLPAATG